MLNPKDKLFWVSPNREWMGFWRESTNACCGSLAAASLLCRTNADETAVTVTQQAESDTNTAGGTSLIPVRPTVLKVSAHVTDSWYIYDWSRQTKSLSFWSRLEKPTKRQRTLSLLKLLYCSLNNFQHSPLVFGAHDKPHWSTNPLTDTQTALNVPVVWLIYCYFFFWSTHFSVTHLSSFWSSLLTSQINRNVFDSIRFTASADRF